MKNTHTIAFVLACILMQVGYAAVPQIKFSGKKDWVIPSAERATVLSVADGHLGSKDSDFIAQLDGLKSPFVVEVVEVVEEVATSEVSDPVEQAVVEEKQPAQVVYDDSSVLRVVGENFAKQVRGTLARGDQNYIQLQGGYLLKTDSSFPVRIPEAQDQTYIVKLIEVTSEDYTLSLGDATLTLTYSEGTSGVQKTP